MRAFLSHSSADNILVGRLFRFLRDQAVAVWFDRIELRPGDSLFGQIAAGIDSADFVLALITEKSVQSPWVQKELTTALSREISGKKPSVIPLVVEPCPVPTIISDKLYVSIRSDQTEFHEIIPGLFRDSFILDLVLSNDLSVNRRSLRTELYEFSRSKFPVVRVRIDNRGFNEKAKEICALTIADVMQGQDAHKENVVRQITEASETFDIHLPLFWTNLSDFLSRLCQDIFDKFGKNLASLDFAVPALANTVAYAMYNLGRSLRPAIFPHYAEKFGKRDFAAWMTKVNTYNYEGPEEFVAELVGPHRAQKLRDVELVGGKEKRIADTRFVAPFSDPQILAFGPRPSTEIFDTTWYKVCVPQIIARALVWAVYGAGKPLHELDFEVGLRLDDYTRMGLA